MVLGILSNSYTNEASTYIKSHQDYIILLISNLKTLLSETNYIIYTLCVLGNYNETIQPINLS